VIRHLLRITATRNEEIMRNPQSKKVLSQKRLVVISMIMGLAIGLIVTPILHSSDWLVGLIAIILFCGVIISVFIMRYEGKLLKLDKLKKDKDENSNTDKKTV